MIVELFRGLIKGFFKADRHFWCQHKSLGEKKTLIQVFLIVSVPCLIGESNGAKVSAPKKQKQEKQRTRKDKVSQHTFSHPLLAATLKVTCINSQTESHL